MSVSNQPCSVHGPFAGFFYRWVKLGLVFLLAGNGLARAHPISLTVALVNVQDERITIDFSMMVEDLTLFYWMETDGNLRFPRAELINQARLHGDFLLRHIHLRDEDGVRWEGSVGDIDFSELPEEGVHIDDLMAHFIFYRLEYGFDEPPSFLTVGQDFGGDQPAVPSEMRARIFHHGVLMETAQLAHGTAHTVRLDWDAGWEHAREDVEAARERLRERREEALGITSYSSVYSFIYITENEIRHELLVPLLTLETWLPLARQDRSVMTVEEQEKARPDLAAFIGRHNRVSINGHPVEPVLQTVQFFGPDIRDFAGRAPAREVSVYNARVGLIVSFPSPDIPRGMEFGWDFFAERMPRLRSAVYPFEAGRVEAFFMPGQTVFQWQGEDERVPVPLELLPAPPESPPLRLPLFSMSFLVLALGAGTAGWRSTLASRRRAGLVLTTAFLLLALACHSQAVWEVPHPFRDAPTVTAGEKERIFSKLHRNLYRAFDHREPELIYDALERSVGGGLLEEVFLQIRKGLVMEEQGGAVSRIQKVEMGKLRELSGANGAAGRRPAFHVLAEWTVTGTVEHWGHVHTRSNRHEARFTIEGLPDGWRITGFDPLREERVDMRIGIRR